MEGYLQKRFKSGIVKTFKKRWYVLKDGELRSYQNEDTCKQSVEMYQECLSICNVQTVRAASESLGVEVVTQRKIFILVASNAADQKRWIQAIYNMMKEHVPRPASSPAETADTSSRKRSSAVSKTRMNRTNSSENHHSQGTFYVNLNEEQQGCTESDVQVNLMQNSKVVEEDAMRLAGDVSDTENTSGLPDNTSTEQEMNVKKSEEDCHSTESEQGSTLHLDRESPEDVASNVNQPEEHESDTNVDDGMTSSNVQPENGIKQLEVMLRNSSSLVVSEEKEEEGSCHEEDDDSCYDEDDDWNNDWDVELEDSGGSSNDDNGEETENAKSAFDQLNELLKT